MRNPNEDTYHTAKRFAEGGSMLVYNQDMADYLNAKGVSASADNAFDIYTNYMARNIEKVYNETKNRNTGMTKQEEEKGFITNNKDVKAKVERFKEGKGKKLNETMDKRQAIIERLDKSTKDLSSYDLYNLAISKLENKSYTTPTERQYWAGIIERYKNRKR